MNTELPQYDGLNIVAFQHSFDEMSESSYFAAKNMGFTCGWEVVKK